MKEKQDKETEEKKVKAGRTRIDNPARNRSFSRRAVSKGIEVIKKRCPYCNHHKAIKNITNKSKCSRCKK